jgi:predicted alpha/beta superfamily hydrolase
MPMLRFGRRKRARGSVRTITGVQSPELGNSRDLHIYLPPDYESSELRYPVLYMQDGQNLFDHHLSFSGAWGANDAADAAARLGYPLIIVGVSNIGESRINEYSPFVDPDVGGGHADRYLAFLLDQVKTRIDGDFRTLADRDNTVIGGSSMGGLLSLYAFFRHPDVFGAASVQSPALWFAGGAMFDYVKAARWHPGRIYLDVGRREGDATLQNARRIRRQLLSKGYVHDRTLKWVEDWRGNHHEFAWGRRLKKALPFLLELEHR